MPRTWSNRKIEHIDLNPPGKGRLPASGWAIVGLGLTLFCVMIAVAMTLVSMANRGYPTSSSSPASTAASH